MGKFRIGLAAIGLCVCTLSLAGVAAANHSLIELSSTPNAGPLPGPYNDDTLAAISDDGSHVFFVTKEVLDPSDTDGTDSLYQRYNGVTSLIGPGPGVGLGISPDGTRVVASSGFAGPIYEYHNGTATLVSTGPTPGQCGSNFGYPCSYHFKAMTPDGQKVLFLTDQPLTPEDTDGAGCDLGFACYDLYVRDLQAGTTTLVSTGPVGGNGPFDVEIPTSVGNRSDPEKLSDDGERAYFTTNEQLVPGDLDTREDVYVRNLQTNTTELVSTGPSGGNGDVDAFFEGASPDGTRAFFLTREALVSGDLDLCGTQGCLDLYARDVVSGTTTLESTGPIGGAGPNEIDFSNSFGYVVRNSLDGKWVVFQTAEPLVTGDADAASDVYARDVDSGTTKLASVWPTDTGGSALWAGNSRDGTHVYFKTDQLYDRDVVNDTTTALSVGPAGSGIDSNDFEARASLHGDRVFFLTPAALTAEDADTNRDLYEWFAGGVKLMSTGPLGGNGAYVPASNFQPSMDGKRVAFTIGERLTPGDPDLRLDVYTRSVAYGTPSSAQNVDVALVPVYRQCGTGANAVNSAHAAPLAVGSCNPALTSSTVAHFGAQAVGSAQLAAIPGNLLTAADEADFSITSHLTDVQSAGGADYNPNASGPDLTLVTRLRITDGENCTPNFCQNGFKTPSTTTDFDFSVPVDCTGTASPSIGADCALTTTADTLAAGYVKEGATSVVQAFRVRLNDSGANGIRGDSDDKLFATQGVFAP